MTALDRLIALAGLRGTLDLRCQLQGAWTLEHAAADAGLASYHLLLEGECWLELAGGVRQRLRAGDILLLPRGSAHALHGVTPGVVLGAPASTSDGSLPVIRGGEGIGALDMLCGSFHYQPEASLMSALPEQILVSFSEAGDSAQGALPALVALLRSEAEGGLEGAQTLVNTLSGALFTLVLRAYLAVENQPRGALALLADRRLGPVWSAVLADLARNWSVEELAACAAMSRATFSRTFERLAGGPPGTMLARLRMERARELLRSSSLDLTAIALEVGYQSQAAFSRAFHQVFGDAPGRFRRGESQ
ncbi:AraC family transcriptional regulator [Pseudomonas sp. ZM23]|uniref:AraC family transcriptional regulator n=1 Tax=Pseudomonas triclosanedens TaxID=2961893 RepID=A0ABY7A357_9PSED|nr:AraC family transcriptional regulator [Pseudomonas triclosanedens]MCP8467745.1 AraC family transcriptional regulator [Pseudomonas triclosanedens]MCP8473712.1 AraC family transcriptional regulator [Pseudomonas triclosanedens]MCP8479634.1 AraC family transcriptional regulator [Pseudomonas triclosanedens]WAI51320.1 AraC family transcriptional regulator [Pseudomonas triclosanedens]